MAHTSMLDGHLRFDTFVVGAANRLAASAARAVAEAPGTIYNPLFLYGNPGLGKTHLLAAVGHRARELHPELSVEYVTLEELVEELDQAIRTGKPDALKRRFQGVGLLLLDDVQFLTGRMETQSEVLRLFNALQNAGHQIVMASDRAPADIADVDERLLNRLSGGLIVDLGAPDQETRLAILRQQCSERRLKFQPGVMEELARSSIANVRELQGALNKLAAQQGLAGEPLTPTDVWRVLGSARLPASGNEFESFLHDIETGVAASVDAWKDRLSERIAWWSGQGFQTAILERAMDLSEAPDVGQLDAAFAEVADRLRSLEAEAIGLDARFAALPVFRDPERLPEAERVVARARERSAPPPAPQPGYDLSSMVRTPDNRLALRAAASIVESPGVLYNPLLFVGATGAGKTHLAHAIGNALARRDDGCTVICVPGEVFVESHNDAMQVGDVERWRARYRAADALIIDGIEAIDTRERSQDELFHLFNAMQRERKQVVLTSDRPLGAFLGLAERLRSRFDGGLTVNVVPLPAEVRRAARRITPVPDGDEAAAPNIEHTPVSVFTPFEAAVVTPPVVQPAASGFDSFFFDSEKVIVEWPDASGRLVEDLG